MTNKSLRNIKLGLKKRSTKPIKIRTIKFPPKSGGISLAAARRAVRAVMAPREDAIIKKLKTKGLKSPKKPVKLKQSIGTHWLTVNYDKGQ